LSSISEIHSSSSSIKFLNPLSVAITPDTWLELGAPGWAPTRDVSVRQHVDAGR
jgi:hypothetical protein